MTTFNIANVKLLRDWVNDNSAKVDEHISMHTFMDDVHGDCIDLLTAIEKDMACGSNMCLIGFAGSSGIEELKPLREDDNWADYSGRVFIVDGNQYGDEWDFLFSTMWENEVETALERMDYVIAHNSIPPMEEWPSFGWEQ